MCWAGNERADLACAPLPTALQKAKESWGVLEQNKTDRVTAQ